MNEPKRLFETRQLITKEVESLRGDHNFSPDTAIKDIAASLRKIAFLQRYPKEQPSSGAFDA
jgi:hypothetical protein